MYEIRLEKTTQLLEILELCESKALAKVLLGKLGGVELLVDKIVSEYKDISPMEDSLKDIYILGELIFSTVGSDTYVEDWNKWFEHLRPLPVGYLIMLLSNWCPKRHCDWLSDSTLSYLLSCYYESNLTKEIYDEISEFFEREELEPKQFEQFRLDEHYKDELLNFNDLKFLIENKYKISIKTEDLKDLLCQVIIGNKLDSSEKLQTFCELVRLFAPSNHFDRKYKDAFVMEIFESIQINGGYWDEAQYHIWKEEFYDINFEWSYYDLSNQIENSIQQESNHISEQLKINPNYRHD